MAADPGEILFLCHRIPFPADRGDKIRAHHILKALAAIAPVHVGTFGDDARDMGFATEMADVSASQCVLPLGRSKAVAGLAGLVRRQPMLVALYEAAAMHRWVRRVLAERPICAVFAYSAQMAHFVPALPEAVRFIMDFVDFDSAKYAAYGESHRGVMGGIYRREGRRLFDFERDVARRADVSLFVSDAEAAYFRSAVDLPEADIRALQNGVDLRYFNPLSDISPVDPQSGPLIVFTGQMDYRPNVEAVESFVRRALPAILARHPLARFAIVGRNPDPAVQALGERPGVLVTGAVADVRGWLAAADVVVAPLRTARGVQNKVLEAMAMARPVVASPAAAEGIDAQEGRHLLVAPDAAMEAQAVLGLLDDPAWGRALGEAARRRMEERYDWGAALSPIPGLLGMAS